MKKNKNLIAAAGILLMLSACSKSGIAKFEPEKNSIFIKKDLTLMSALVETADKDMSVEGLGTFVQNEVDEYKRENPNSSVMLTSTNIDNNTAKIIYAFNNFNDLKEFALYSQDESVEAESMKVYTFEDAKNASDLTIDLSKVKAGKNSVVVLIDGASDIYTEGKIIAIDGNIVETDDSHHVVTGEGESIIIFK